MSLYRPALLALLNCPALDVDRAFLSPAAVDGASMSGPYGEDGLDVKIRIHRHGFMHLFHCRVAESGADLVSQELCDGVISSFCSRLGVEGLLKIVCEEDATTCRSSNGESVFHRLISELGDALVGKGRQETERPTSTDRLEQKKIAEDAARIKVMATVCQKIIQYCESEIQHLDLLRANLVGSFEELVRHIVFCLLRVLCTNQLHDPEVRRKRAGKNLALLTESIGAVDSCFQVIVRVLFEHLDDTDSWGRSKADFLTTCMKPLSFLSGNTYIVHVLGGVPGLEGSVKRLLSAGVAMRDATVLDAMRSVLSPGGPEATADRTSAVLFGAVEIFRIWAEEVVRDRSAVVEMLNTIHDPSPTLNRSCLYFAIIQGRSDVAVDLVRQGLRQQNQKSISDGSNGLLLARDGSTDLAGSVGPSIFAHDQEPLISDSTIFLPADESEENLLHLALWYFSDVTTLQLFNDSIEARRAQFLESFKEERATEEEKRLREILRKTWNAKEDGSAIGAFPLLPYLMYPKGSVVRGTGIPVSSSDDTNTSSLFLALNHAKDDDIAEWTIRNFDWGRYPFAEMHIGFLMEYVPTALSRTTGRVAQTLLQRNAITFEMLFGKKSWYCAQTGVFQGPADGTDGAETSALVAALENQSAEECLALCDVADDLWRREGFPNVVVKNDGDNCSIPVFPAVVSIVDASEYPDALARSRDGCNCTDLFYHRQTSSTEEDGAIGMLTTLVLAAKKLTYATRETDPEGRLFLRILQHACRSWSFLLRSGQKIRYPPYCGYIPCITFFSSNSGIVLHEVLTSGCVWAATLLLDKERIGIDVQREGGRLTPWSYHSVRFGDLCSLAAKWDSGILVATVENVIEEARSLGGAEVDEEDEDED